MKIDLTEPQVRMVIEATEFHWDILDDMDEYRKMGVAERALAELRRVSCETIEGA